MVLCLDSRYCQEDMTNLKKEEYRRGLEYHDEVKNNFHLKIINYIRKKKFGSGEIWTPVPWTRGQSYSHITTKSVVKSEKNTSKVILQSNQVLAGDSKIQKL